MVQSHADSIHCSYSAISFLCSFFFSFHSVGSVGRDSKHASYSSSGAALFLSAPGGDRESFTNNIVASPGGGCRDATVGTSFACPIAAGVVALMLEANGSLTWRDVQGILATTSQQTDAEDPSWTTNAAGLHHSNLYGFGVIDANAAVAAAQTWENYSAEEQLQTESGTIDLGIPEYPSSPVSSVVTIGASDSFAVESVVVYLDLSHSSRGDLQVVLTSPSGTDSVLSPGMRPENTQVDARWKLMTVRNWGEPADGDWTLSLVDQSAGDHTSCADLSDWLLTVGGVDIGCDLFQRFNACQGGGQGSGFFDVFGGATGISDPVFNDASGVGPTDACCECGGGTLAANTPDVLRSWRLMVYGHSSGGDSDSALAPADVPAMMTAAPTSSPAMMIIPTGDETGPPKQPTPDTPLNLDNESLAYRRRSAGLVLGLTLVLSLCILETLGL